MAFIVGPLVVWYDGHRVTPRSSCYYLDELLKKRCVKERILRLSCASVALAKDIYRFSCQNSIRFGISVGISEIHHEESSTNTVNKRQVMFGLTTRVASHRFHRFPRLSLLYCGSASSVQKNPQFAKTAGTKYCFENLSRFSINSSSDNMEQVTPTPQTYTGVCYCGEVEFSILNSSETDDNLAGFCHCDSCRRAHAAPLYQVVYVTPEQFQITRGEELVNRYSKHGGESIQRWFCSKCGSRVANYLTKSSRPQYSGRFGFFPSLLAPEHQAKLPKQFEPSLHFYAEETVLAQGKSICWA